MSRYTANRTRRLWKPYPKRGFLKIGPPLPRFELPDRDFGIFWGGGPIPSHCALHHFCVCGGVGSGKTTLLRLLMQSVLPSGGSGAGVRAIVFDFWQNLLPVLAGMGLKLSDRVVLLNAADARTAAWDMANDIDSPMAALEIASILLPGNESARHSFLFYAARHLLGGVFQALIKVAPKTWTFGDVMRAVKSRERLTELLDAVPEIKEVAMEYLGDTRTASDVLLTLTTEMARYDCISTAWEKAGTKISLREWLQGDSILVLGTDEEHGQASDAINRAVFEFAATLCFSQGSREPQQTWFFLDGLPYAGVLRGLDMLIYKGRTCNTVVVLSLQSLEQVQDVYGASGPAMLEACGNMAYLNTTSPQTAEWAAQRLSRDPTRTWMPMPSDLMHLPNCGPETGLTGFFQTYGTKESGKTYGCSLPWKVLSRQLTPPDPAVPDFQPWEANR